MTIQNSKVKLDGIELQINPNGAQTYKLQVQDNGRHWLSRSVVVAQRNDDDSMGFDITMLDGSRRRLEYASSTGGSSKVKVMPQINNNTNKVDIYKKLILTTFDFQGTALAMEDASKLYSTYKAHQKMWAIRQQQLQMVQDPDITIDIKAPIYAILESFSPEVISLDFYGITEKVSFAEGQTCTFSNWLVGRYTDFSISLVAWEDL
jgi:hypothetical protein